MIVRATKKNNEGHYEWSFGRGLSSYKSELKQIEQDITSALLEFKNDCFWALNHGIDWLVRLGYKNQKNALDRDIVNVITNRFGVVNIQNFTSRVIERNYSCECEVYTIYSEQPIYYNFSENF